MLLGIFVAKGDVGVGTIVGSAVFNVVCVIGVCGLFVNGVSLKLKKTINLYLFNRQHDWLGGTCIFRIKILI